MLGEDRNGDAVGNMPGAQVERYLPVPNRSSRLLASSADRRSGIPREKVSQSVARQIIADVAGLKPGTRLQGERALRDRYGVSRASLREALRILEVQGLIAIAAGPNGGAVYMGPNSFDLGRTESLFFHLAGASYTDLVEALVRLEPTLVRLCAERPDHSRLIELEPHVGGLPEEIIHDTNSYRIEADAFHGLVSYLSGNVILAFITQSIRDLVVSRIRPLLNSATPDRQASVGVHASVAAAILAGDASLAEHLMKMHMQDFRTKALDNAAGMINDTVAWS